jgi:hypothetical protein
MFEMTFPDGIRRGMAFDSPSHARGGAYVTAGGSTISRADWPKMRRVVLDELTSPTSGEPKKPMNPLATTAKGKLRSALKAFCDATGLEHEEVADQLDELLDGHERERVRAHAASLGVGAGEGAGALDDDEDDDASVERRVRELLTSKGLDDEAIEEALKRVRADREAARDSRPQNAIHGGRGGRLSHATKDDVESEYGGEHLLDLPDYSPDPNRGEPGYNPAVYRAGLAAAAELPGGGTSRRLSNDAALASDEDLARDYGNAGPGVGMFGRG